MIIHQYSDRAADVANQDTGPGIKATKLKRAVGSIYNSLSVQEKQAVDDTVKQWASNGPPSDVQATYVCLSFIKPSC